VDVRPAKDGAHRPPQSAGAVRRQASASRRPHPASLSIRHHLCPERLTTYSSSSQGSGNSSSSILISTKSRACRILASRVRGGSGDTDTTRPQGDTNDFNSSAKKDRQTTVKATTEGPSSSATAGDHGAVGNATRPSLASFDGVKTGQEPAEFERPTDLDAVIAEVGYQHGLRKRSWCS